MIDPTGSIVCTAGAGQGAYPVPRVAVKALPVTSGWSGWGRSAWPNLALYDFGRHDLAANSVVAVALAWIRRNIVKGRIVVGNEQPDGTYEEVPGHPLIALLRRPNPRDSWRATLGATSDCLCLDGNAYWIKARSRLDRSVSEVYWVPNHQITIEPETDPRVQEGSGPVRWYRYTAGSFRERYKPADIVHFRDGIDPYDRTRGCSDLKRQIRNAASIDFAERYTSAVLRNAHAGKVLAPKEAGSYVAEGSPDETEMIRVAGQVEAGAQGENVGRITKSTIALDLLDLGMGPEDMALDRIHHWPAALLLAALGLNPLALNLPGGDAISTFANKAEARAEAHTSGVNPRRDLIADELEQQLLPDFPGAPADSCWWDLRDVDDLQEDADKRAARAVLICGGPVASEAEGRALLDLPGGDERTPSEIAAEGAAQAERIAAGADLEDEELEDEDLEDEGRPENYVFGAGTRGIKAAFDEAKHPRANDGRFGARTRKLAGAVIDPSKIVVAFKTDAPGGNLTEAVRALRAGGLDVVFGGQDELAASLGPGHEDAVATYNYKNGKIYLNPRDPFWDNPTLESQERGYYEEYSTDAPEHVLQHEAAHALHHQHVGDARIAVIATTEQLTSEEKDIAGTVSKYAAGAPGEFVAEAYVGMLAGKKYGADVLALYTKFDGPPPPGRVKAATKALDAEPAVNGAPH